MRSYKAFFLFLALIVLGQALKTSPGPRHAPGSPVVVSADLSCAHEDYLLQRHYTSQEKLRAVLTYLRLVRPLHKTQKDPEAVAGERYCIRLHFSSGPDKVYLQHSHRFLSADRDSWLTLRSPQAKRLHDLMTALPSDP